MSSLYHIEEESPGAPSAAFAALCCYVPLLRCKDASFNQCRFVLLDPTDDPFGCSDCSRPDPGNCRCCCNERRRRRPEARLPGCEEGRAGTPQGGAQKVCAGNGRRPGSPAQGYRRRPRTRRQGQTQRVRAEGVGRRSGPRWLWRVWERRHNRNLECELRLSCGGCPLKQTQGACTMSDAALGSQMLAQALVRKFPFSSPTRNRSPVELTVHSEQVASCFPEAIVSRYVVSRSLARPVSCPP